jgi:hypothetical protein
MSRIETAPSATLLRFPAATADRSLAWPALSPSRGEVERAIARGRRLQGEALRNGFRRLYRVLVGGCSLRSLRLSGAVPGKREACC